MPGFILEGGQNSQNVRLKGQVFSLFLAPLYIQIQILHCFAYNVSGLNKMGKCALERIISKFLDNGNFVFEIVYLLS